MTDDENLIQKLREPLIIDYDVSKYPFREAIISILEEDCLLEGVEPLPTHDLSKIHKYANHKCSTYFVDRSGNRMAYFQTKWNINRDKAGEVYKGLHQNPPSDNYLRFESIYNDFMKEVIGPGLGGGEVLYQRAPTFRTFLPMEVPMGKMHNDEEYHHQPSELNFWMPISDHVGGNNSLYVESRPMLGDFSPITLRYGQVYRGYMNQCRHYTEVNDTDFTRVSIDFRAVSNASGGHDPTFHAGVRRGAKAMWQKKYDLGGFYVATKCDNRLVVADSSQSCVELIA